MFVYQSSVLSVANNLLIITTEGLKKRCFQHLDYLFNHEFNLNWFYCADVLRNTLRKFCFILRSYNECLTSCVPY